MNLSAFTFLWALLSIGFNLISRATCFDRNVTRSFYPQRSLCQLKENKTSCASTSTYLSCSGIESRAECESGWAWVYCRQPTASECYWEEGVCTSVSERNGRDTHCPQIVDRITCIAEIHFEPRPPFAKSCFWDESESRCASSASSGIHKDDSFEDLENLDPLICHNNTLVSLRVGICNASQIHSAEDCLSSLPLDDANKGKVANDLYSNALDMLGLSQYIYEYAALKDVAWRERNVSLVQETHALPMNLDHLAKMLKQNLPLIKKNNEALDAAIETMHEYLSDPSDENISVETTKGGRSLYVFADSEWHVRNSMVYAILVNKEKMRVDVVFRGSSSRYDWSKNLRVALRKVPNPVKEQNATLPYIRLHSGFAKILLGDEEKPGNCPLLEIFDQVVPLMENGYRFYVTGHSLGGALATLFAFYAATNDDILKYGGGPVSLFTYASPKVGASDFRKAFKLLEARGKLRHARFRVQGDKVPQVPFGRYVHVGVEIHLRQNLPHVIDYPAMKDWKQAGEGVFQFIRSLPAALTNHRNEEILRLLKRAKEDLSVTTLGTEYRFMWGLQPKPNVTKTKNEAHFLRIFRRYFYGI